MLRAATPGIEEPSAGAVNYLGHPVRAAAGIPWCSELALVQWLPVMERERAARPRSNRHGGAGEDAPALDAAIDLSGRDGFESDYPRELSGRHAPGVGSRARWWFIPTS